MASTENKSSAGNSDHVVEDPNAASLDGHDQTLLKSLQALIVPLIHQTMDRNDIEQMPLGPEAEKLITALKEFISSVVRSRPERNTNAIKVNLSEEDVALRDRARNDNDRRNPPKSLEKGPISKDMVFKKLREHVFNQMPIRLLCFERLESGLQISLVERKSIYARIEATMQMNEEDLLPRVIDFGYGVTRVEKDDEVIQRLMSKYTQYAILSHTWLRTTPGEVTYGDWNKGRLDTDDVGYRKLVNFCKIAWRDYGVAFGWMDTVCINKDSSSELDESIRSMYKWYQRASVCIVYLAETETLSYIHLDPWFTRGWTLQELLAPRVLKFYNADWKKFSGDSKDDKKNMQIMDEIERATTISIDEFDPIFIVKGPISRKMQLAAQRQVTREEDAAYSIMGIFNVSFAIAYGEGASRAFSRLLQEILATTSDGVLDIFNWAGPHNYTAPHNSRVLPGCIENYNHRSTLASEIMRKVLPIEPITLTHLGLHVPVILMPAISTLSPASKYDTIGDYYATVDIRPINPQHSNLCATYHLLDKNISGPGGERIWDNRFQLTFAVLSFTRGSANVICIETTCLAMALKCSDVAGKVLALGPSINVINTEAPIVFDLMIRRKTSAADAIGVHVVKTDKLPKHGMQLVTMYL